MAFEPSDLEAESIPEAFMLRFLPSRPLTAPLSDDMLDSSGEGGVALITTIT